MSDALAQGVNSRVPVDFEHNGDSRDELRDEWEETIRTPQRPRMTVGGVIETTLKHPTFVVAAVAAVPILALIWGVSFLTRRGRVDEGTKGAHEGSPTTPPKGRKAE